MFTINSHLIIPLWKRKSNIILMQAWTSDIVFQDSKHINITSPQP